MVRFGRWTFDPGTRLLTDAAGTAAHVTPKAFDLLALLIEQAPRVVRKADLHARLWPDTFVSDATLAGLVKELRRVLDDSDESSPIIRTSHRVGYAFCCALDAPAGSARIDRWVIGGGRRFPLRSGENVIGRDPSSDVHLDAAGVSRRHARIVVTPDGARLNDLGSKNGTRYRGEALREPVTLRDGDCIGIGSVEIVYRVAEGDRSTETLLPDG